MSASRRPPVSSRNPQRPLQSHIADANDPILFTGIMTLGTPLEPRKNKANPPSASRNLPILTAGTTAHGPKPGRNGYWARNSKAQKAPANVAPQPKVPQTAPAPQPPANFRRPSAPRAVQAHQVLPTPRGTLTLKPLPASQPLPRQVPRPKPMSIPKPVPLPKPQTLPKRSPPVPKPLPIPQVLPITRAQLTSPVKGQATVDDESESESKSENEEELKIKKKKILTPEQEALKALRRKRRREERERKKADHYQLVLSAAEATISILKRHGLSSAVFGSLACKLYGTFRDPKDVDLLVFQPLSSDPDVRHLMAEQTKALLVDTDPIHFYLKLPRDPEAPYRILYYRRGPSKPFCKVDILVPGTMYLPSIPPPSLSPGSSSQSSTSTSTNVSSRNYLTTVSGIPLVPFSLLLLHKLQGWADHRSSLEQHKKRKEAQDAADVRRLLEMGGMITDMARMRPWTNPELFCEEFQQLTKERVKEYCKVFPKRAISWKMLGFETT